MKQTLNIEQQQTLLAQARASIVYGCKYKAYLAADKNLLKLAAFSQIAASFITLKTKSSMELRGCTGTLTATKSLLLDVIEHAYAAAFQDSRFAPVREDEIDDIHLAISVISPMELLPVSSERELLANLRPNMDGLLIEQAGHRATFLPSVWEQLRDKQSFLRQLKQKAGLSADYWSADLRAYRYTTCYFQEPLEYEP
ncbi:hypothetical protein SAMN02745866_04231 [Alteromonadaceae bacterium Bs31]|nr:hypothetical protein SAMN02745866_04231 [Alteromonadaceae bacterium Bs31]